MIIKRIFLILLSLLCLSSCNTEKKNYFPLGEKRSWSYQIDVIPEIETKKIYKKINSGLKKQKITSVITNEEITVFPIQRENNSIYFYTKSKNGISRIGVQFSGNKNIIFEKNKRFVIKYPLKKGSSWNSMSKTYLTLRRYPYFDYKAITDFEISNQIISTNEIVKVPAGEFKNCIQIKGLGETNFVDREIGSIKIKILTNEWYAPNIGLIKSVRVEETDTDLFGTTKMVQVLDEYKF